MAPPTAGPASTAIPTTPLKMPSARARSSLGKAVLSNAMPSGITNAAPAPCAARAAISARMLVDSAQATDEAMNSAMPAANRRRRPNRSPSAAPVSSSTAKLRLKALTVHCSASIGAPKSARRVASAAVNTWVSSATMKDASAVTPSTQFFSSLALASCIASLRLVSAASCGGSRTGRMGRSGGFGRKLFFGDRILWFVSNVYGLRRDDCASRAMERNDETDLDQV